jgi:hypothetical protein
MQDVHEQILKVLTSFYGTPTADQRDHIASMAEAVMGEAVAPRVAALQRELAAARVKHQAELASLQAFADRCREKDWAHSAEQVERRAAAEAERDLLRETLAESDLGAQVLAQWEAVAAADADRDRLVAERDALKAAWDRLGKLIESYPPGSDFAQSGAQDLFRRMHALDAPETPGDADV